jgi:hypothetical protein
MPIAARDQMRRSSSQLAPSSDVRVGPADAFPPIGVATLNERLPARFVHANREICVILVFLMTRIPDSHAIVAVTGYDTRAVAAERHTVDGLEMSS